jgi:hypothetical protein
MGEFSGYGNAKLEKGHGIYEHYEIHHVIFKK